MEAGASRGGRRSDETKGGEEMTLGPIYKVKGEVTGARIEEPEYWIPKEAVASIVGGSLTDGEMYHF